MEENLLYLTATKERNTVCFFVDILRAEIHISVINKGVASLNLQVTKVSSGMWYRLLTWSKESVRKKKKKCSYEVLNRKASELKEVVRKELDSPIKGVTFSYIEIRLPDEQENMEL